MICNELAQLVGLSHAELLVWEFGSWNPEGFLFFVFPFYKFLSLVSGLGLVLGLGLGLALGLGLGLGFEPSSPIVREHNPV